MVEFLGDKYKVVLDIKTLRYLKPTITDLLLPTQIELRIGSTGIFSILGPSGCGKSSLLKSLAGLSGIYDGLDFKGSIKLRDIRPSNVYYCFQESALLPWLKVRDNLDLVGNIRNINTK